MHNFNSKNLSNFNFYFDFRFLSPFSARNLHTHFLSHVYLYVVVYIYTNVIRVTQTISSGKFTCEYVFADTPSFAISRTPGFGYPLREGIEVSLKCDVDSNPPSTPLWQKDEGDTPVSIKKMKTPFPEKQQQQQKKNEKWKNRKNFSFKTL